MLRTLFETPRLRCKLFKTWKQIVTQKTRHPRLCDSKIYHTHPKEGFGNSTGELLHKPKIEFSEAWRNSLQHTLKLDQNVFLKP